MIQVFKTDEDYKKWLDGQRLPSGIVVYVSDDETMYFSTNNIKGELKTYKCEKEEPIQYPPLIYSAKSAGSTITVNGQSMTLEQGDNITLDYPNEITTVSATDNTALTAITMPNTMTFINGSAFKNCYYLTNINMPNTITVINPQAFRDCINLINITIPENVKNIYDFAFMGCTKLSDFNYNGTTAQWRAITLGTDWNFNSAFTVVHCTDGDVTL